MNGRAKFSSRQGRPISVRRAVAEQIRWKRNPENKDLTDAFDVPMELLQKSLRIMDAAGVEFCNGSNDTGGYSPVMAAINEDGKPLFTFDPNGEIPIQEFLACRRNWKNNKGPEALRYFYLGKESILENIENFDVTRYQATFVEKADGQNSGLLLGFSGSPMKDPEDEIPDTALNIVRICPPDCDDSI